MLFGIDKAEVGYDDLRILVCGSNNLKLFSSTNYKQVISAYLKATDVISTNFIEPLIESISYKYNM